jgi:hypothetical protein
MGVRTSKSLKIFQGCTSGISVHQLRLDNYVRSIPLFFFCLHLSFNRLYRAELRGVTHRLSLGTTGQLQDCRAEI